MRIIAGLAKGRIIKAPKGLITRPTLDKIREAIFSSLGASVAGSKVLDLYAGSGALGLEAISRGAKETVFVDYSKIAIRIILDNAATLGFSEKAIVVKSKADNFLKSVKDEPYDLIFLDAPYKISVALLKEVAGNALKALSRKGILIIEHSKNTRIQEYFKTMKSKDYGQTTITYLGREQ